VRASSRVAWTSATLALVAGGNAEHGAFVALNCAACHGELGVSQAGLYPTLAATDRAAIEPYQWTAAPPRGIPPCAACHGPGDHKLAAPQLKTQQPAYIERQLAAFAQGFRQNDINELMRTIAAPLKPDETHVIAEYYGTGAAAAQRPGVSLTAMASPLA
jgi:cytochrome c553